MPSKQYTDEQIVRILQEFEQANCTVTEFCRRKNISEATYYTWKKKFKGLQVNALLRNFRPFASRGLITGITGGLRQGSG